MTIRTARWVPQPGATVAQPAVVSGPPGPSFVVGTFANDAAAEASAAKLSGGLVNGHRYLNTTANRERIRIAGEWQYVDEGATSAAANAENSATEASGHASSAAASAATASASASSAANTLTAMTTVKAKTANYTALAGDVIAADTAAGAWTLTLPAGGGIVTVSDAAGTWATNALTVAGNGATIAGGATFALDLPAQVVTFTRTAADAAWRFHFGYSYGG